MATSVDQRYFAFGDFYLDTVERRLYGTDNNPIPLSSRAVDVLHHLLQHPGKDVDKGSLMAAVWPNTIVEENNLNQAIAALRKALGETPDQHVFILTIPGRGYRFIAPVQSLDGLPDKSAQAIPTPNEILQRAVKPEHGYQSTVGQTSSTATHMPFISTLQPVAIPSPVRRASLNLGEIQPLGASRLGAYIALSRDGRQLVYAAQIEGTRRLYHRPLDQLTAQPLPGTENAYHAFFSPDGEWIIYEDEGGLHKVSIVGGPPQQLAEREILPRGAFWSEDDVIYFSTNNGKLHRIGAEGGIPEQVSLQSEYANWFHAWPDGLPGGSHLLLTVHQGMINARDGHTVLLSLATGETRILIRNGFHARYVRTGHVVFLRSGSLWAVPFDVDRLMTTGPEVPVVHGVQTAGSLGQAIYAFSDDGWLIYLPGGDVQAEGGYRQLIWVERDGAETLLPAKAQNYFSPRLSPDATQVAVAIISRSGYDIWTLDLDRGTLSRRTFTGNAQLPCWTPDGSHLVYTFAPHYKGLAWVKSDGTGQPEPLLDAPRLLVPSAFTPDGSQLVYFEVGVTGPVNLYVLPMTGDRSEQPLLTEKFDEIHAALSPDGKWLAYVSTETGQAEIYVRPFPGVEGGKWQVSTEGGLEPRWRGDGKELFYRLPGTPVIMNAVPVETEQRFAAGTPMELFRGDYFVPTLTISYDVTADGQRFLLLKAIEENVEDIESHLTSLVVVENWFEDLQRLAPPAQ